MNLFGGGSSDKDNLLRQTGGAILKVGGLIVGTGVLLGMSMGAFNSATTGE